MQPGDVVGPGGQPEEPKQPVTEIQPPVQEAVPVSAPQEAVAAPEPENNWQYQNETDGITNSDVPEHEPITWTASEYIAHDKSPSWYILVGVSILVFSGLVYVFTQELVSSIVIVIMGIAFGAFGARKPQELTYVLDNTALVVGNKTYPYAQFKSFSVIEEDGLHSVVLMPLQRFMPPLSIYFDPSDEDKIADTLSLYLPYEERKHDFVDSFMRKLKF